jgi:hypothetical protein
MTDLKVSAPLNNNAQFVEDQGGNQSSLALTKSGNIGIGTINPSDQLEVDGGISLTGNINGKRPQGTLGIHANGWSQHGAGIELRGKDEQNRPGELALVAGPGNNQGSGINFYNYTGSGWNKNMTITNQGDVGIGTDTPDGKLDVDGNIYLTGNIDGKRPQGTLAIHANGWSQHGAGIELYGKDHPNRAGELALVAGPDNGSNQGRINFFNYTGTGWRSNMTITSQGDVGIGTNQPSERLVVEGNACVTGSLKVGAWTIEG